MTQKKYRISLDGLPDHEHIIFKLICSVSERTKNRTKAYSLINTGEAAAEISINDIKNKSSKTQSPAQPILVWVSDKAENDDSAISRPLIATRVLNALDNLIDNIDSVPTSETQSKKSTETTSNNKPVTEEASIDFNITEEEASELAIVHDEVFENPANKETLETPAASNVELTLIKGTQTETKTTSGKNSSARVLVVDDSPSVRKQLEIELEFFDVSVDFAECAEAAFNLLNANRYDLALLDVVLPDKDGFQICKFIKAQDKSTIAIMLTGKATQADKIKGSLAGCNAYLVKPVGRQTFQNTVKNYLALKSPNAAVEA